MDGRVLHELFIDSKTTTKAKAKSEQLTTSASFGGGKYTLTVHRTLVGEHQYVDFAKVERVMDKP